MSIDTNEQTTIEVHKALTRQIKALKDERAEISNDLRLDGIKADGIIKADLETVAKEARKVVQGLSVSLTTAERNKARLDQRIDAGDDTVTPLEVVEADMAVRRLKGKRQPADAEARKAQRALDPFLADNHLALLASDTISELVDVPVLVRKRPGDVKGISDAIVLSQVEPIENYGSAIPSGRVKFTEVGNTGLDLEALEAALRDTGAEVQVHPGLIDYEVAVWPVPRLKSPSQGEVAEFARVLSRVFQATVEGPTQNRGYATYATLWETTKASLEVTAPSKAKGTLVANFGVERERPPLMQMSHFITEALSHFETGVTTSAGLLDEITLVEVLDAGPWLKPDEAYIHGRGYPQRFIVKIELDYSYIEVV